MSPKEIGKKYSLKRLLTAVTINCHSLMVTKDGKTTIKYLNCLAFYFLSPGKLSDPCLWVNFFFFSAHDKKSRFWCLCWVSFIILYRYSRLCDMLIYRHTLLYCTSQMLCFLQIERKPFTIKRLWLTLLW